MDICHLFNFFVEEDENSFPIGFTPPGVHP
jgi:hypothetical protein